MNSALQAYDIFLWKTEQVIYISDVGSGSGEKAGENKEEEGSAAGSRHKQTHCPSRSSG